MYNNMKIAIPVTRANQVDDHFGHCEYYGVYTISEKNEIVDVQTIKSEQGCGCKSNIAGVLANQGVTVMLAGGIGGGAINVLNNWGIDVVRGCSGNAADIVKEYVLGTLTDSGESCHQHEQNQGQGHNCNS
jgi:predicted Fe-Mo cluster-binding NifX family protein